MPNILISDESMERLKSWAEPLVDTADSALQKVLDAAESNHGGTRSPQGPAAPSKPGLAAVARGRGVTPRPQNSSVSIKPGLAAARPAKLPQKEFREPLLEVIYELGGSAHVHDLRPALKERIRSRLLPGDFEHVSGGAERWWNAACWERHDLVNEGYIRNDSPRGIWALSETGIDLVKSRLEESPENFTDHLRAMPDAGDDADFDRSS